MKLKAFFYFLFLFATYAQCYSQSGNGADSINKFKTIAAGRQYKKSGWHRFLWGNNYRNIWTTPVTVPVFLLDTAKGGLTVTKEGGGHQTKSLHLKSKDEKQYALRSVDKTLGAVLPENFKGTFLEKQVNDEVSMSDPYGALIVPVLAEAAHIYHTNPVYVYLPDQPALDSFNEKYGNKLYLFEQRPDGNWSNTDNLGNFDEFFNTEDVIKKMLDDNHYKIDQPAFVKARIFDWFINDWDRHEDQWSWGERKINGETFFVPVPQDRDQAFSIHDGLLLNTGMAAAGLNYMQPFADNLKNVKTFTYEERNLDRFFTNEVTLGEWQNIAAALQQSLTDAVIDKAVKQLPPEIFNVSGKDISAKLKARRKHFVEWATDYYNFISKQVQITGSKQNEQFEIDRLDNNETSVKVFDLNKKGQQKDSAFYSRIFNTDETNEIRLFGIDGNDVYIFRGASNNMNVRIIGGPQQDSVINQSAGKLYVYDDDKNFINKNPSTKLRLSSDSSIHDFNYDWFKYDKAGIKPSIFYSFEDRIYVGLGYQFIHNAWRKQPFASKQLFDVHYSLSQKAFSYTYSALFPHLIGKSDVSLLANYDAIRWIRFWGLGNGTQYIPKDINYFTTRSRQWIFQPGIIRRFGFNTVTVSAFTQGIQILKDTGRFISKSFITNTQDYKWKTFAGAELNYKFQQLNDSIVPTKGFIFSADATGAQNLKERDKNYFKFSGTMQYYLPLTSKFSYVLRAGAANVTGKPEFYQYTSIGGAPNLRGLRRDRYWGKTNFWNMNDIRFISPIKSHILNGKGGLIAFFDDGRVWMPGENSNTWHTDYGGGITLAPFNKILIDATYGISNDDKVFTVRVNKYF